MEKISLSISRTDLGAQYRRVRAASETMCAPLSQKDFWTKQPIVDVSPPGWNIGHTSWFFRNLLERFGGTITDLDRRYDQYLNSYYSVLGDRLDRARRGDEAWIPVPDLFAYRASIDERMEQLIETASETEWGHLAWTIMLGLQHERQHQELFYTEAKYFRYTETEQRPFLSELPEHSASASADLAFTSFTAELSEFGNKEELWAFDNEYGVHAQYVNAFAFAHRLVTNAEYVAFIDAKGYAQEDLWQAEGWQKVQKENWIAPLYWEKDTTGWRHWTFAGMRPLDPDEPVSHVSFWEAEAYARWLSRSNPKFKGVRLPTEYEWEYVARKEGGVPQSSNFIETNLLRPRPFDGVPFSQLFGDVWEWTTSLHVPYPGYQPFPYPFSEYTSKFMYSPLISRGGSCVSERDHIRTSYRNYWAPDARFQVSGIRLAMNVV